MAERTEDFPNEMFADFETAGAAASRIGDRGVHDIFGDSQPIKLSMNWKVIDAEKVAKQKNFPKKKF